MNKRTKTKEFLNKNKQQTTNDKIVMGTWNVRSTYAEQKINQLLNELKKYEIDVIAIQETKQKDDWINDNREYTFFNSGDENRMLGTGFMVNKRIKTKTINFKPINERMCYLRIRGKYRKISLLNIHTPTEEKDEDEKDKF